MPNAAPATKTSPLAGIQGQMRRHGAEVTERASSPAARLFTTVDQAA